MLDQPAETSLHIKMIGSAEFSRRLTSALSNAQQGLRVTAALPSEAWGSILADRPDCIAVEIGFQYDERAHKIIRALLSACRERLKKSIYTIVALVDSTRLFYGGDLLFEDDQSFQPSGLVDSFIAAPPGLIPSVPPLYEQLLDAINLVRQEFDRRAKGQPPLPSLGEPGWAQSLCDPKSRDLWMRWLPRYASYTNENPIIIGETGTGKTNLAYALHLLSGRKGHFVSITPRDFSSSELVQAELFGAVSGAYTGAVDKWGLVKSAEKGTLFIDELQSIDKDLQGKLITFIENKSYRRVGSAESTEADVRFVFASNRTLYDMMSAGVLRDDFAYRLERMQLELAPLAQRRLDVASALAYALAKITRQRPTAIRVDGFTPVAYRLLFAHSWPGNLRQLENTVAQLSELADMNGTPTVTEAHVGTLFQSKPRGMSATVSEVVSQAAFALAQKALSGGVTSLEDGIEKFVALSREVAVETSGGDYEKASALVQDDPSFLRLVSEAEASENLIRRYRRQGGDS